MRGRELQHERKARPSQSIWRPTVGRGSRGGTGSEPTDHAVQFCLTPHNRCTLTPLLC